MEFQLNTDNTTAAVRRHFGVDGMIKSIVNHRRHGDISSVEINSVFTKRGMPYFDHLKCLVMDAEYEQELLAKKLLERNDKYKSIQSMHELAEKYCAVLSA